MVSGDRPSNNREGVRTGRATTGQGVERSQSLCRMSGPGRVKQTEEHESSLDLSRRVEVLAQLADEQEKLRANLSLGLSAVQAVSFLVAQEDEKALRLSAAVSVERKAAHALGVIQDLRVKMRERCGYLDRVVSANTSRLLHVQTLCVMARSIRLWEAPPVSCTLEVCLIHGCSRAAVAESRSPVCTPAQPHAHMSTREWVRAWLALEVRRRRRLAERRRSGGKRRARGCFCSREVQKSLASSEIIAHCLSGKCNGSSRMSLAFSRGSARWKGRLPERIMKVTTPMAHL